MGRRDGDHFHAAGPPGLAADRLPPAPGTDDPAQPRQLDPTEGDPMEVLRRLLRDAAG
mgnify:CR=1 FL=1